MFKLDIDIFSSDEVLDFYKISLRIICTVHLIIEAHCLSLLRFSLLLPLRLYLLTVLNATCLLLKFLVVLSFAPSVFRMSRRLQR